MDVETKPRSRRKKVETVKELRARLAGNTPGPRGGSSPFDLDQLGWMRMVIKDEFRSAVDGFEVDRLLVDEAAELIALVRSGMVEVPQPEPQRDSPAMVEAFVARTAEWRDTEARGPNQQANANLLTEYARSVGRQPTPEERRAIMANRDLEAGLEALDIPAPREFTIPPRFDLGRLDETATSRLQGLIERAMGAPEGSVFEAPRRRAEFAAKLRQIVAPLAPGPRKRRYFDEPGVATLPAGLLEDILRTDATQRAMTVPGLAVFAFVSLAIENRKLPPAVAQMGYAALEDTTLVVMKGVGPWGVAGNGIEDFGRALEDCRRCHWLDVLKTGNQLRISYGPKMRKHLARREESES